MPCHSTKQDMEHAKLLCKHINLDYKVVDLSSTYDMLLQSISQDITEESQSNIKPRLRMITLYALAQHKNYLVLGTGNRAEIILGYFTKYGDGASDVNIISDLTVSEVFAMADALNIPKEITEKPPSAGLWHGQTDEDELGIQYSDVDALLEGKKIDSKVKEKIVKKYNTSKHKRKIFAQFKDLGPLNI